MHVRPGRYTSVMQRDVTRFSLKLFEKAVKNQVARQDSRHGGPEESRDAKHTVLNLAQLRWTGHIIRMPGDRLPKKVFFEEPQKGKRFLFNVAGRNDTKTPSKPL